MGWVHDKLPEHEGYLLGLVRDGEREWRELGLDDPAGTRIHALQVGCACGWRSPRFYATWDAKWFPVHVAVDEDFEDTLAYPLWLEHVESCIAKGFAASGRHVLGNPDGWRARNRAIQRIVAELTDEVVRGINGEQLEQMKQQIAEALVRVAERAKEPDFVPPAIDDGSDVTVPSRGEAFVSGLADLIDLLPAIRWPSTPRSRR